MFVSISLICKYAFKQKFKSTKTMSDASENCKHPGVSGLTVRGFLVSNSNLSTNDEYETEEKGTTMSDIGRSATKTILYFGIFKKEETILAVSYTHLTLPTIYSV